MKIQHSVDLYKVPGAQIKEPSVASMPDPLPLPPATILVSRTTPQVSHYTDEFWTWCWEDRTVCALLCLTFPPHSLPAPTTSGVVYYFLSLCGLATRGTLPNWSDWFVPLIGILVVSRFGLFLSSISLHILFIKTHFCWFTAKSGIAGMWNMGRLRLRRHDQFF